MLQGVFGEILQQAEPAQRHVAASDEVAVCMGVK
jgi:hypothetical protein